MDRPLPVINEETKPYWDGAKNEKLMVQQCPNCEKYIFYPRALCPHCFSDNLEWKQVSGKGEVYSFTVCHRAGPAFQAQVPFVVALIDLAEGPRMLSNIQTTDVDSVRIGQRVEVVFEKVSDKITLPKFKKI